MSTTFTAPRTAVPPTMRENDNMSETVVLEFVRSDDGVVDRGEDPIALEHQPQQRHRHDQDDEQRDRVEERQLQHRPRVDVLDRQPGATRLRAG